MPCIEDWVSHPLNVIDGIGKESGSDTKEKVREFFAARFKAETRRIPSINDIPIEKLRPNSLVKFRCMVQDMFGPEYFLSQYEIVSKTSGKSEMRSGMYRDMADCPHSHEANFDSARNVTDEKNSYFCVPIPGETEWAKEGFGKKSAQLGMKASQTGQSNKRALDEEDMEQDQAESGVEDSKEHVQQDTQNKKPKVNNEMVQESSSAAVDTSLNHPIPGEQGPPCIIHVYDQCEDIKLNDMIEFVGVVSIQPKFAAFAEEKPDESGPMVLTPDSFMSEEEHAAHYPPTSLVPRLHCVFYQHLKHSNPSIPLDIDEKISDSLLSQVVKARDDLLSILKDLLLGDEVAAEYLLLHLVSSVYTRCGMMAVGKFTLNLCGCPVEPSFTKQVSDTLMKILPKCVNLPMTLNNMNTLNFVPKKDYTANRLISGFLQLSDSTQLILDETALEAGQLNTKGVQNVTALETLISWQKLEYDFDFYKTDFQSNIQVLVLSEGKSMLPCDCHVKLEASSQQQSTVNISEDTLNVFRTYIGLVRSSSYSITPDMQKALQEDFVEARQRNPSKMTADDFHRHLLVARLLALSSGSGTLTQELWEKVKMMEEMRKARIQQSTNSA